MNQLPSSQRSDVRAPASWDGRVVILRISSSPSSMPWLRQMLCSTQQARMIWQTFSGSYSSLPPDASPPSLQHAYAALHYRPHTRMCCIEVGFLGCLSAQSGWEAIGDPVLRRKSSFTFRCSWALYGHVIHFGYRGIISSNNANAAISPTENCHYQAFCRL